MDYLYILILIAAISSARVVRRLIRPLATVQPLDPEIADWIRLLTTCDDHAVITHYAKVSF